MSRKDWSEYEQLVLHRLDSTDERLLLIEDRLRKIEGKGERIAERISVTAAIIGFVAGTIPTVIMSL